jgi:probable HAF family extracellular repeat protein
MRSKRYCLYATVVALFTGLVSVATAQSSDAPIVSKYTLYDVGTLGGNFSVFYTVDMAGDFTPSALNQLGQLAGTSADSSGHIVSFVWKNGSLAQLPSLPHGNDGKDAGSNAVGVNDSGLVVGISSDGQVSPFNGRLYEHAVSWPGGKVHRLGDLGGSDSNATFISNHGLVVGYAFNTIPDPYGFYGTQLHATTWRNGKIQDLGTLGGTDSQAWTANGKGQVIGISFLNTPPGPPFNQPQDDAFVWSNGVMTDLGTLGGGFSTPTGINSSGQVTVLSFDSSNQLLQSFLWTNGSKIPLTSLGGNFWEAVTLNDRGTSVGANTDATDANFLASAWDKSGAGRLLGTVDGDTGSIALGINQQGVVVGGSGSITLFGSAYAHAFVWQKGEITDLNTLIPQGSPLTLNVAYTINNAGVIAGSGTTSAGETHAFLLVPASGAGSEKFESAASAPAAPGSFVSAASPVEMVLRSAKRMGGGR